MSNHKWTAGTSVKKSTAKWASRRGAANKRHPRELKTLSATDSRSWYYHMKLPEFMDTIAKPVSKNQWRGIALTDYGFTCDEQLKLVPGYMDVAGEVTADHPDLPAGMDVTIRVEITEQDIETHGADSLALMLVLVTDLLSDLGGQQA